MELPGNTFCSSSCRQWGRFAFPPVTPQVATSVAMAKCVCVCVRHQDYCVYPCCDVLMTSSIGHVTKNICHRLCADCSSAFQGNDLHLSTLTDHLSWSGFSSVSQSLKHQMKHRGLWGVILWWSRSLLACCAVISGCFNVARCEHLASETESVHCNHSVRMGIKVISFQCTQIIHTSAYTRTFND